MSRKPYYDEYAVQNWIHDLARAETLTEADLLSSGQSLSSDQKIEESTMDMMTDLRASFQECVRIFNALSEGGKKFPEIKLFSLSQSSLDFMLYRNGLKLMISNVSHGVIQLSFEAHQSSQKGSTQKDSIRYELVATLGLFSVVQWMVRGEKVDLDQATQYFFKEFVRASKEEKKLKPSQKVLLEQIKTLLEEQGLQLK